MPANDDSNSFALFFRRGASTSCIGRLCPAKYSAKHSMAASESPWASSILAPSKKSRGCCRSSAATSLLPWSSSRASEGTESSVLNRSDAADVSGRRWGGRTVPRKTRFTSTFTWAVSRGGCTDCPCVRGGCHGARDDTHRRRSGVG